ncbi:hypothetical protein DI005_20070 [Prauserella sp. PE36]|uniref:type II toxin-antitoxin system Phd/YefM family antitoxin n=1 Tax=Prauserella sp. PE36 TaxID=1504709 RepID=UPI000DE2DE93|nr:type II toxin-antitoxin system Phd/YefM family antitoxin [Prauserella sp. PE36]RBM18093.1 hypothetical protein DI005_20070 [Prauserella sp. PE36]
MASMAASEIKSRSGAIRRALKNGEVMMLTFHDKPWARVIPEEKYQRFEGLEDEVAQLRAELAKHKGAAA